MNKGTLIFQIPKDSDFEFSTRTNLFEILKVFDLESFVMRRHCHDFVLFQGHYVFSCTYLDIQNELRLVFKIGDEFSDVNNSGNKKLMTQNFEPKIEVTR